ncbi:hypothetical protein HCH_03637 [Hahella chejuensis KCTC 2396]|uniref:Uncharacterized protein n=1 Tax=Hahella chejuensis (strain KCTC 2396) TaxID=349521 RepID=Q2SG47_HAHCH|nr:hypothetical protein HCH_03637 [Hahella chejuensis KCTC 2396]
MRGDNFSFTALNFKLTSNVALRISDPAGVDGVDSRQLAHEKVRKILRARDASSLRWLSSEEEAEPPPPPQPESMAMPATRLIAHRINLMAHRLNSN